MMSRATRFWVSIFGLFGSVWCGCQNPLLEAKQPGSGLFQKSELPALGRSGQARLTILATNDIHGGVEPSSFRGTGDSIGGMAFWGGVIRSTKTAIEAQGGRVLVLDAGDQFQGSLISNTNEGELVFSSMDQVGYDAVVPGNHDYDFGPKGWLKDRATLPGENGREVIEGLAARVRFPLLSANTYLRESLQDVRTGERVEVTSNSCAGPSRAQIDWSKARRPGFLRPYLVRDFGGMRVAIIGMDHPSTAAMTTAANVSDLCFRDPVEAYREIREEIGSRADVFILVIHSANSPGKPELTRFVKAIRSDSLPRLDAVIAGHTHMIQKEIVDGVPIIQSGSGGERFGRIDFVFDLAEKRLVSEKTEVLSGLALHHHRCDDSAKSFCLATDNSSLEATGSGGGDVFYHGVRVVPDSLVSQWIASARESIRELANRKLFVTKRDLRRDRVRESPLADLLTDLLRESAGADLSFINTGGIRTELKAGEVTYEQFFEVLPFGNRGVVAGPMKTSQVIRLLERSIRTCGDYGALMQSGLRVRFKKNCKGGGFDSNAQLLSVETTSGERLYDSALGGLQLEREFTVATLDFLLEGGSGYDAFKGTPLIRELDIVREDLVRHLSTATRLREVESRTDGRWYEVYPSSESR